MVDNQSREKSARMQPVRHTRLEQISTRWSLLNEPSLFLFDTRRRFAVTSVP
jgi:hypothetical protein